MKERQMEPKSREAESIDSILEEILSEGQEVGHGQDGVILKLDLKILSPHQHNLLVRNGILSADEISNVAVKVLKIYNAGTVNKEFEMQKRARELLLSKEGAASVPNTTVARDQHLDKNTQDLLRSYGARLGDRAEIIVMDYIDGKDLGTMLYEFVLQKIGYSDEQIARLSYNQKEQLVRQEVGFEIPNLDSAQNPEEVRSAIGITDDRNDEKLFKYLKRKGFSLDPVIFEKVENAVRILNQNSIHHNDLHKGNVMIDTKGEVYIIDFGRSNEEKREGDISDTKLSQKWKKLSMSDAEEQTQIYARELEQITSTENRMQSNQEQKKRTDIFIDTLKEKGTKVLETELALSRGSDTRLEQFFIMLHIASKTEGIDTAMISVFIKSLGNKDRGFRPFESNKIQTLQKIGYLN